MPAYDFRKDEQSKMGKEKKLGKLRSMRIEPAANGFTVESHHEPHPDDLKKSKDGGAMSYDHHSPKPHVFADKKAMFAHISDTINKYA